MVCTQKLDGNLSNFTSFVPVRVKNRVYAQRNKTKYVKVRLLKEDIDLLCKVKTAVVCDNLANVSLCKENIPGASFRDFFFCYWIHNPS